MKIASFILALFISTMVIASENDCKVSKILENNQNQKIIRGHNSFDIIRKNYYIFQLLKKQDELL